MIDVDLNKNMKIAKYTSKNNATHYVQSTNMMETITLLIRL